jgi:hypothetical protein
MNRQEAYKIISATLERYRGLGFRGLSGKVGAKNAEESIGESGVRYTLDISIVWADPQHHAVVIHGRIDDQNTFRSQPLEEKVYVSNAA